MLNSEPEMRLVIEDFTDETYFIFIDVLIVGIR
jgi:hypothetical protein